MLKGLSFGALIFGFFKLIYKFISMLVLVIANILVYFGLWIPFFYMILSGSLMLWGGLDLKVASVNTNLFKFGLVLSLICAVILTIRSLLVKPLSSIANFRQQEKRLQQQHDRRKKQHLAEKHYVDGPNSNSINNSIRYYNDPYVRSEPPLIYRSARNPELLIHEYRDRFEVFSIINNRLVLVEVRQKEFR